MDLHLPANPPFITPQAACPTGACLPVPCGPGVMTPWLQLTADPTRAPGECGHRVHRHPGARGGRAPSLQCVLFSSLTLSAKAENTFLGPVGIVVCGLRASPLGSPEPGRALGQGGLKPPAELLAACRGGGEKPAEGHPCGHRCIPAHLLHRLLWGVCRPHPHDALLLPGQEQPPAGCLQARGLGGCQVRSGRWLPLRPVHQVRSGDTREGEYAVNTPLSP